MSTHEKYMQRCLDLAIKGLGKVSPNPMVGCVIVHEGKIIGEGYHRQFGEAHAEVNAIQGMENEEHLKQATLYVNLEPCSHFGKTPPCADLIIDKKIPKVVIGSFDPNPLVAGKGIARLKEAGVEVITDVLRPEADFLNRRFITFHTNHRPYIILKWAESKDGFMALTEQKQFWFTTPESKKLTHKWRSEEAGILVGRNTVEVDDPELTVRDWGGENPLRIVIDKELKLPNDRKIFNDKAETIVFNHIENREEGNIRWVKIDFSGNVTEQILNELYGAGIVSIIVEGGPNTLSHFIEQNLWDEARISTTPRELKIGKRSPEVSGSIIEEKQIETDQLKVVANTAS